MRVHFYCEPGGKAPVLKALKQMRTKAPGRFDASVAVIQRLAELGSAIGQTRFSEPLGEGLFELKADAPDVTIRLLYFYHGGDAAILLHVFVKKSQKTPPQALKTAKERMRLYKAAPDKHRLKVSL